MELIIDYRERALVPVLKQGGIEFREDNLLVGDIHILKDGALQLVIERKTASDYVASIRDKRLKNQIARLDKLLETEPQARFLILVEGPFQSSFGYISNIPDIIYNSILNRVLTDNIPVIRSDSSYETVIWLKKILHKLQHDSTITQSKLAPQSTHHYLSTLSVKKKDNLDQYNCFVMQLSQIPGVSISTAQIIADQYKSFPLLINAYQNNENSTNGQKKELLSEIKIGQRRLGKVLSIKIYEYIFQTKPKLVLKRGGSLPLQPQGDVAQQISHQS